MDKEPMKKCSHCKEEKPLSEFSARSASKDGKSYNCKKCEREIAMASYKRRKKKRREQQYYEANRDRLLELSKQNYQDKREMRLQQGADYRAQNPEVAREAGARRRERLKQQKGEPYTREEAIEQDTLDGVLYCRICHEPIEDLSDLHIDHVIPLLVGGIDDLSNVRCVHKGCNIARPKDGRDLEIQSKLVKVLDVFPILEELLDPKTMGTIISELYEFALKVKKEGDCLIWTGAMASNGRGAFKGQSAPRYIWSIANARQPHRLEIVSNTCGNKNCVNPEHLIARRR